MRTVPRSGFTLIELMIVIGILGLLVAVLSGVLMSAMGKGEIATADNFCNNLMTKAITDWQDDNGKNANDFPRCKKPLEEGAYYDGNVDLFKVLITDRIKADKAPYIPENEYTKGEHDGKPVFLDPWETPYVYRNYKQKKILGSSSSRKFSKDAQKNQGLYDIISLGVDRQPGTDDIWNGGQD
ncbi:MAG: prepilin-type N-terminal cleavage/methylation domain-containing protein [Planctomycetota bacterium]